VNNLEKYAAAKVACMLLAFCSATAIASPAQTFTTLFNFDLTDGAYPYAPLIQGANGNLYGATSGGGTTNQGCYGGTGNCGTFFKISPAGALTTLYDFCSDGCDNGSYPNGLTPANDGDFYGATFTGGTGNDCGEGCGAVFKITPTGELTSFYSFCLQGLFCPDGANPAGGLVQATNQNFYGTTSLWGANASGTIFQLTPQGDVTTLYSFCAETNCDDGSSPQGTLIQATNGRLYGTATYGGRYEGGVVFQITTAGQLTVVYSFCEKAPNCADGLNPIGSLIQGTDGNFYGTTQFGGAYEGCEPKGCGTVFKLSPKGALTTLYSFCAQPNCADGWLPSAGIVQASDGNFYGTTRNGGANAEGSIFELTSAGVLTTLHSFDSTDGTSPYGPLLQATDGQFYGTTSGGGTSDKCLFGCGTIFNLSVGLGPFVVAQPASGVVGAKITILGNNLTGSTSVTFNGTPATFRVISNTAITATVPVGATTGTVEVTTIADGVLDSNIPFRVTP
jgi:uncharacterized repeat protein (TIGR03803 family)